MINQVRDPITQPIETRNYGSSVELGASSPVVGVGGVINNFQTPRLKPETAESSPVELRTAIQKALNVQTPTQVETLFGDDPSSEPEDNPLQIRQGRKHRLAMALGKPLQK